MEKKGGGQNNLNMGSSLTKLGMEGFSQNKMRLKRLIPL